MPTIYKPKRKKDAQDLDRQRRERMKIYNSQRWRELRAWKMICNPLCEECEKEGKIVPVDDVHHIVSFTSTNNEVERKRIAYDFNNLMSLCDECHRKKHNVLIDRGMG